MPITSAACCAPASSSPREQRAAGRLSAAQLAAVEDACVREAVDELRRRIDEAARFVPLERLCSSPQCGFASTHHGNAIAVDEQWRKLERVVEVAELVWGGA